MLGHHNSHNRVSNTLAKKREPSKYMIKIFILQWAMQLHVLYKAINKQIINHNTIDLFIYTFIREKNCIYITTIMLPTIVIPISS